MLIKLDVLGDVIKSFCWDVKNAAVFDEIKTCPYFLRIVLAARTVKFCADCAIEVTTMRIKQTSTILLWLNIPISFSLVDII